MAEQVHLHLEARLPELEDLIIKGIFDQQEVREIISVRTKYEYRLKRRNGVLLDDFLDYIEYEKLLETTRRDRIRDRGLKLNNSISDRSILHHIYSLYYRALVKFGGDAGLWIQLLEFARLQGGRKVFARAIAKALQLHPLHAPIWIIAAEWEWKINGNISAARSLLYRAISFNDSAPSLYLAFFRLELEYSAALSERRSILGLLKTASDPSKLEKDSTDDLDFDRITTTTTTTTPSLIESSHVQENDMKNESLSSILSGDLALIIFEYYLDTMKIISKDTIKEFMQTAMAENELLFSKMSNLVSTKYPGNTVYISAIVKCLLQPGLTPENLQKAMLFLDVIFTDFPTPDVITMCIELLETVPNLVSADCKSDVSSLVQEKIIELFKSAIDLCILTPEMGLRWFEFIPKMAESVGETDQVHLLTEKIISHFPAHPIIEAQAIKLQIGGCEKLSKVSEILSLLLKKSDAAVCRDTLDDVLRKSISIFKNLKDQKEGSLILFDIARRVSSCPEYDFGAKSFYLLLEVVCNMIGAASLNKLCGIVRNNRVVDIRFYKAWIKSSETLHKSLIDGKKSMIGSGAGAKSEIEKKIKKQADTIRLLYQKAIGTVEGEGDCEIWKAFINFEQSQRCYSAAALLYQRAVKMVPDPKTLIHAPTISKPC